jgi:magnesium chelatase family protein
MPRLDRDEMLAERGTGEGSTAVRRRVEGARLRRLARGQIVPNARLGAAEARDMAALDGEGRRLLGTAIDRLGLTARGCDRVIRVARTIADLDGSDVVGPGHLAEAIRYRSAGGVG